MKTHVKNNETETNSLQYTIAYADYKYSLLTHETYNKTYKIHKTNIIKMCMHFKCDRTDQYLAIDCYTSAPVDNIGAMMIVWSIRGKVTRTVPCFVVYDTVVHNDTHKLEQFLKLNLGFRFSFCVFV